MAEEMTRAIKHTRCYEKLVIPELPAPNRVGRWEIDWVTEVEPKSFDALGLRDGGSHREFMAGNALYSALEGAMRKSPETPKDDVESKRDDLWCSQKKMISGRQVLWMVLEHFKTNRSLHKFYTYDDLSRVKWMGDAKLDVFLKEYRETLRSLASTVDDETLTEFLLARLRQSKVLSPDIQYFDRLDDNAPERCHRTLLDYIERHLARKRRETMREKVSVGVGRGGTGG